MSMKTISFGFPIQLSGKSRLCQRDEAFLLTYIIVFDTDRTVLRRISLICKTRLSLTGLGNGIALAPFFLFRLIKEVSIYQFTALKIPKSQMRPVTQSITLESIRERVSNVHNLLETKRTLNEVFMTYFVSSYFADANEDYRNDATYLAILLNDLLDELFIASLLNAIEPCKS